MAVALPKYAVTTDDVATQLYSHLSRTLANSYTIYQHLSTNNLPLGTLFCLQQKNQFLLVFICDSQSQPAYLAQLSTKKIVAQKKKSLRQLLTFQQSLFPEKLQTHTALLAPLLVILPKGIEASTRLHLATSGIRLFGHDALIPKTFLELTDKYMGIPLSDNAVDYVRCCFNPESTIPTHYSLYDQHQPTPQLKQFLLNKEQEFALKQDLVLNTTEKQPHQYNLRLIHGIAGSGKSLILLYRAKLLRDLYPDKKILVLTHNKAINHYLTARYKNLFKHQNNECHPFMAWCLRQWKWTHRFVHETEVIDIVDQTVAHYFKHSDFNSHLFLREINFIKDRLIFTENDYLKVDRSGQAYPIDAEMRTQVWQAILAFNATLKTQHILLWIDLPHLLWHDIQEGKLTLQQYDHVLIDEAQYFAPIWFELIKKAVKPKVGQLFMVSDPDQGFLNRTLSWKETGIDLRNRTFRLQQNYRSNPLILKVADEFHFNRIPDESSHMLANKTCNGRPPSDCSAPTLLHFHHERDEKNRLLSEVHTLLQQGTAPKDILILDADSSNVRTLLHTIKTSLNQPACLLTDPYWDKEALRICDLASATGLESKIVFITGLKTLFEQENRKGIHDREHHTLRIENTRKLYMGITRASKKLTLLLTADRIPKSLQIKEMSIPTIKSTEPASVRYLHA